MTFTLLRYGIGVRTWLRPIAEMQHMFDDRTKALWTHDHNRRWMNEYMSQILQIIHRIINALAGYQFILYLTWILKCYYYGDDIDNEVNHK